MKANILYLAIFLITTYQANAAHVFATQLSYRCLGNSQYEVTLTLYRDCGGTAAPINASIQFSSYSCNQNPSTVNLTLDSSLSYQMVTPYCNTFALNASCNGGNLPSDDIAVYKGIITLPAQCPDWIISFSFGVRSSYYTNLVNPASGNIYIEALLDNSFGACYDSPVFKNHPMLYACAGQPFRYDMGALDKDGDTLKYTLLTPLTGATQNASFQPGLSLATPFTMQAGNSLVLNNRTGDLAFRPQGGANQFAALTIRVDKWQGGKIVASTMAEMDIAVSSFCNNAPIEITEIKAISGVSYIDTLGAFIYCNGGNQLNFSTTFHDLDGDSIAAHFPSFDLDSVFGPANYTILLYNNVPPYTPDSIIIFTSAFIPLTGISSFSLGATDNACPYNSIRKETYQIFNAFIKAAASDAILCEGNAQTVQLGLSGTSALTSIQWIQVPNGAPSVPLSNPNIPNPTIAVPPLPSGTILKYIVSASLGACSDDDTLVLHVIDTPNINLSVVNTSSVVATDGSITASSSGYLTHFDYQWQTGSTSPNLQNLGVGNYWLTVTDFHGCQSVDSVQLSFGTNILNINASNFSFKIFPNPSVDKKFQLQFNQDITSNMQIEIFNLLGQTIPFDTTNLGLGGNKCEITVPQAVAGIYYLKLTIGREVYTQKIVLE